MKEGVQASLAADFSISQFSHVARLILVHGRNSYKRSAALSQFVIHRGLIISIIQAVFSSVYYFASVSFFQGLLMIGLVLIIYCLCLSLSLFKILFFVNIATLLFIQCFRCFH